MDQFIPTTTSHSGTMMDLRSTEMGHLITVKDFIITENVNMLIPVIEEVTAIMVNVCLLSINPFLSCILLNICLLFHFSDMMGGPNSGFMHPRGMGMDGPRPRFHGPPRGGGGGRPGGPPSARGGPSNQPCWHFMRGFCRLENRCKFLHPNNYNGAPMP